MILDSQNPPDASVHLLTRLDDAGLCENVNEAVLEAAGSGLVRNVSLMVPAPAFAHAAERLRGREDLCLGLHVTLNAEWENLRWRPLSAAGLVGTLIGDDGGFLPTPHHFHQRRSSAAEMMTEIRHQLDAARRAGLDIRYLDEHMGVSWVCDLREPLAEFARSEGLVDAHPIPFLSGWNQDTPDISAAWVDAIRACPAGMRVLLSHVAFDREDFQEFRYSGKVAGEVATERDAERRAWSDPRLREAIASGGVKLLRYDEVPRTGGR